MSGKAWERIWAIVPVKERAVHFGLPYSTYRQLVLRRRSPRPFTLKRLIKKYDLDAAFILKGVLPPLDDSQFPLKAYVYQFAQVQPSQRDYLFIRVALHLFLLLRDLCPEAAFEIDNNKLALAQVKIDPKESFEVVFRAAAGTIQLTLQHTINKLPQNVQHRCDPSRDTIEQFAEHIRGHIKIKQAPPVPTPYDTITKQSQEAMKWQHH